jgi:hypothetical protein
VLQATIRAQGNVKVMTVKSGLTSEKTDEIN